MRVFVTGASGFIGRATVPELIANGHEVVGLARSDEAAAAVEAAGATVLRGSIDDLDILRQGAADSDGVIHLAYNHDFSDMPGAAKMDLAATEAFGEVLAGSDRPLIVIGGTLGLSSDGGVGTETDFPPSGIHPRTDNNVAALALKDKGVRSMVVRFAPSVHDEGDKGFIKVLVEIAREKGKSAYVGDGANRWPGIYRGDAATLLRLAVESAPAGSVLHGIGEEGVPTKEIAELIGKHLDLPVVSITPEETAEHFGWIGLFFSMDAPASNEITKQLLGWNPTGPTLLQDIDAGHYFEPVTT
jgi:nucleoside-diphosphate-sugar epimerase